MSLIMTGPEMSKVSQVRRAMREDVTNVEYFEKCYSLILGAAMSGQNSVDFTIDLSEREQYEHAINILNTLSFSGSIYEDGTGYFSWQG